MDNVTKLEPPASNGAGTPPKRQSSTIQFPYSDLDDGKEVAGVVQNKGGGAATTEQGAAWLGHSTTNSGGFRNKIAAARIFGLIETTRNEITITDLGREITDPKTEARARVKAFLKVPLYARLYDRHKGGQLPNDVGLEHDMVRLGVTRKQVQNARQVFLRSAEQAGFFSEGRTRLVLPAGNAAVVTPPPGDGGGGGNNRPPPDPKDPPQYPKLIDGLLEEAPWNDTWNEAEFLEWIDLFSRAARVHFKLPNPERQAGRE